MKTHPSLWLILSVLAVPCLGAPAAAQQRSSAQSASASPQVRQAMLSVIVVDKKGALVTNLTAKDFTLTEDGRPQVITGLTTSSNLPFRLGLLVDTSRTVMPAMDAERKAAEKFVDQMLPAPPATAGAAVSGSTPAPPAAESPVPPGDQAFLIHFDREVELLEDFTNSRDKLNREIDEMGPTAPERSSPQGPETSDDDRDNGQARGEHGNAAQLYDAIYLASDQLMKSKDGRKALIVFSDGADHGSRETLNDAIDAADRANLEVCTIYYKGQEERQNNGFPGGRRGGMGGGYPGGYPGGWPGGGGGYPGGGGNGRRGPTSEAGVDGRKIMQEIAQRTGGMFFDAKKKDDLDQIYGWIASGLRQQYLLTYTPDKSDADGDFHKILIKVNNPDYTVESREGYYAPEEK